MKKLKSPLRYPGGKTRVARHIVSLFPDGIKEYREPFLGGGSVFIECLKELSIDDFWINDANDLLISFWQEAIYNNDMLIEEILELHKIKDKTLYEYLTGNDFSNKSKRGAKFFALNRITFSGTTESGGYSKSAHKDRFTTSSIERVKQLSQIKDMDTNIKITSGDYIESILASGEDVLIYLDPPYYSAENSALYGKNGSLHKGFRHEDLLAALSKTKHKWIMTYDSSDYIKDLFKDYYQYPLNMKYSMTKNKGKTTELIITNYKIDEFEQEG